MRRALSGVLLALGGLFLALSIPAGYLNRTVLDSPAFAQRVDELRRRDDVSRMLGREVARQVITQNPDLVALAPLVEQVATGVVASDLLSGPVRVAAAQFHGAFTGNGGAPVLRIADVGAVVAAVLGAVTPERAPQAAEVAATLADIGSQAALADVIRLVGLVDTLAWLLPALALACLLGAVGMRADRWDGVRQVGWAVVIAAGAVALVVVAGRVVVRAGGGDPRAEALVDGVWAVFVRPVWPLLGLVAAVGALTVVVGSGRAAAWNTDRLTGWLTAAPRTTTGATARAAAFVAVGVATVVEPGGMVTAGAFVAGVLLVVAGVGALARLAAGSAQLTPAGRKSARVPVLVAVGLGFAGLAGLAVWGARPPGTPDAGAAAGVVTGVGEVCNGHAELCDRRFDEVSYLATHNSMAVAGEPGWFIGEQGLDIIGQLDFGVRALLIDVWYGRDAGNGAVRTAARSYEEALAVATEELGPEIVAAALRVVDAVAPGEPQGPEALFMCHGLCEIGATSFDATLRTVRAWLATHPDEVVTIVIEDHVDAADIGAAIDAAGLAGYAFTPVRAQPFPTLGDMIRSGKRLVVMLEAGDGRPHYRWLVNGFEFVQETPFTFPTVESFSCAPNRGEPDAPLLLVNHWLFGFRSLVSDARLVNTAEVLGTRVRQCRQQRGMQPTFVAVNYADIGDTVQVVDALNGLR